MEPREAAADETLKVSPRQPILARSGPGWTRQCVRLTEPLADEAAMIAVVMLVTLGPLLILQPWRHPKPARIRYPRTPRSRGRHAR
jgi:hypothetical protein